ncbi:MAG: hypothetical protein JW829_09520, partial [Pirellulales bacterium]|nr:hypothetical protein [Pirellulales bacterium]
MVCNWPGPLVGNTNPDEAINAIVQQLQRFEQLGIFQKGMHERFVASVLAEREQLVSELAEPLERPPSVPIRATSPPVCPEVIEIPQTQKAQPIAPIEAPLPTLGEPPLEESEAPPATVRDLSEQAAARARAYATRRAGEAA